MNATSAKNAAKKFQIEDDFYCQNTAGPKKTFLKGNLFMTARVTAFEFTNKTYVQNVVFNPYLYFRLSFLIINEKIVRSLFMTVSEK